MKYSLNVINKSLNLRLKKIRENDKIIIYHCPSDSIEDSVYKIIYDKNFDEINCECQEFKFKRKCSHSLAALHLIKGNEWFWKEVTPKYQNNLIKNGHKERA